ncbi:MAG: HYR domain-containing protein, partial [Verrucomicrobia bacterium]|nr:HYR domain-containing protein [Verrucomicrobiota bacterium]
MKKIIQTVLISAVFLSAHGSRASEFIVTTTVDSGPGSLRQAILDANGSPGTDTIAFNIGGAGPHTIQPLSPLPTITYPVIIDGYTQPGASPNTLAQGNNAVLKIELDGSLSGPTVHGLYVIAGNSAIRGLVINRFSAAGIYLYVGDDNVIQGNFIGTDTSGTVSRGNGGGWGSDGPGVLADASSRNRIGGALPEHRNLISGNGVGVYINDAERNLVQGNYIGTDKSGTAAVPNSGRAGVFLFCNAGWDWGDDLIGGAGPGEGNLISGNGSVGLSFNSRRTVVQGNLIGTDVTGTRSLPNSFGVDAGSDALIGGTAHGAGNLISGNIYDGLGLGGTGTRVEGNLIGSDLTGTSALGNGRNGIHCNGAEHTIGGATPGCRNIISGNAAYGIEIGGGGSTGNRVQGNFIGTDITGTAALGNSEGVFIGWDGQNLVGGIEPGSRNVISGNGIGLDLRSSGTLVRGNFIGTDVTGTVALGNGCGIYMADASVSNTIGGTAPGAGNVISGNATIPCGWCGGILLNGPGAIGNRIQGNLIGTDVTGIHPLGNGNSSGVNINGGQDNVIGGPESGAGNVIAANGGGIWLGGAIRTRVQGNLIGTDRTGTLPMGNGGGLFIVGGSDNTVGGTELGAGNVIAASVADGSWLMGKGVLVWGGATANRVQGNFIGTDFSGTLPLGNDESGVWLIGFSGGAFGNVIGGTESGAGNIIAFNGRAGVSLREWDLSPARNPIRGNSIHSNAGLGIDLYKIGSDCCDGPTPNDEEDVDGGCNNLQNFPVLTSVSASASTTTIEGTLNSTLSTVFTLDFYANSACDPSSYGEGERYLGSATVTTDDSGNSSFRVVLPVGVPVGWTITATATDPDGNTSEFSACSVPTVDTTPPVITTPANIVAEATSPAGAVVTFSVSAQDAVSGAVAVTCVPPSGSVFPLGTTTVTVSATDEAGNTATATFTVTVRDTMAPIIQCPSDILVPCAVDLLVPVSFAASATDVCDP